MAYPRNKEDRSMKCSLKDCHGQYERKTVIHTVRQGGQVVVIDHVPAEVCAVCGDVLFRPETVQSIEKLLREMKQPDSTAPIYEFA
jgi:YgiT-type zinc finger domain-containing protein